MSDKLHFLSRWLQNNPKQTEKKAILSRWVIKAHIFSQHLKAAWWWEQKQVPLE